MLSERDKPFKLTDFGQNKEQISLRKINIFLCFPVINMFLKRLFRVVLYNINCADKFSTVTVMIFLLRIK